MTKSPQTSRQPKSNLKKTGAATNDAKRVSFAVPDCPARSSGQTEGTLSNQQQLKRPRAEENANKSKSEAPSPKKKPAEKQPELASLTQEKTSQELAAVEKLIAEKLETSQRTVLEIAEKIMTLSSFSTAIEKLNVENEKIKENDISKFQNTTKKVTENIKNATSHLETNINIVQKYNNFVAKINEGAKLFKSSIDANTSIDEYLNVIDHNANIFKVLIPFLAQFNQS